MERPALTTWQKLTAQLEAVCAGGLVTRYHAKPTLLRENVAEHSYYVAWLCRLLVPDCSKNLLLAALAHDIPEWKFGDIPSPTKKLLGTSALAEAEDQELDNLGFLVTLTEEETFTLKLADNLAGMTYCLRECQMGNQHLSVTFDRYRRYICSMGEQEITTHSGGRAVFLLRHLVTEWEKTQ